MSAWHGGPCKYCDSMVWAPIGQKLPEAHRECIDVYKLLQGSESDKGEGEE